MAVKVGVLVPQGWHRDLEDIKSPVEQFEAMVRVGKETERLGFDSIWLYDHFHTVPTGEASSTSARTRAMLISYSSLSSRSVPRPQ